MNGMMNYRNRIKKLNFRTIILMEAVTGKISYLKIPGF
jgi:hypothetical protein